MNPYTRKSCTCGDTVRCRECYERRARRTPVYKRPEAPAPEHDPVQTDKSNDSGEV